ncbi:MAG: Trm112 family protein [Gemmatimonadota bacterium]
MKVSDDLFQILRCPRCKGRLRREDVDAPKESLTCDPCRLRYPVRDGIPIMLTDEAQAF